MSVPYGAILSLDAAIFLDRISEKDLIAFELAIDDLCLNRQVAAHVKKLKGAEEFYRKRIGNYRILFEVLDDLRHDFLPDLSGCRSLTKGNAGSADGS